MARTIDNLGIETSTRYAEDQEYFDASLIRHARDIPSQTGIATTSPTFQSEVEEMFQFGKGSAPWASFLPPPNYSASRRRLFAEQLIPKLGRPEMQESQMERVDAIANEEKKKGGEAFPQSKGKGDVVGNEKQLILNLLQNVYLFDQQLIDINSRRAQYQKG